MKAVLFPLPQLILGRTLQLPSAETTDGVRIIGRVPAQTQRAYGGPVKPSQAEQFVVIDANRKQRLEE
jgi:hypothetical protein